MQVYAISPDDVGLITDLCLVLTRNTALCIHTNANPAKLMQSGQSPIDDLPNSRRTVQ